jgi:hypothetical protein
MVQDACVFEVALVRLLADRGVARDVGARGRAFVERHRGAARRTVDVLKEVIDEGRGVQARAAPPEGRFRERTVSRVRI